MNAMSKDIVFIAKDATWQKYRNDVLTQLGQKYDYKTTVATTGKIQSYISESAVLVYKTFRNLFPQSLKASFFPGGLVYIARTRPDAVLALPNASQLTEFAALPLCKSLGIPIIYWTHGFDHFDVPAGLRRWIHALRARYILWFSRRADHVIAFSDEGKRHLVKNGVPGRKITVAHNTLDTESMLAVRNTLLKRYTKPELKERLGFGRDSKVLLYSGRLNSMKRVDFALRVHKRVTERIPSAHFVIIGYGEEQGALLDAVRGEKIPNVHFLGRLFDEAKLAEYFMASDLFLMPGYVGLAIIHAFSFGLPLLTGGPGEVIHSPEIQFFKHGKNGFMLPLKEDVFANQIIKLFEDSERLTELSEHALATASNEGHIDKMLAAMDGAFKSVMKSPRDRNNKP